MTEGGLWREVPGTVLVLASGPHHPPYRLKDWAFEAPFSRLIQHEGNGHTMVARIYKPAKTAMQSGTAKTHYWVLEHEPSSAREIDPLMGWTSSGDMNTQVTLRFETRDEAIAYAEKHKIAYQVFDEQPRAARPKSYSDNFRSDRVDGNWTH